MIRPGGTGQVNDLSAGRCYYSHEIGWIIRQTLDQFELALVQQVLPDRSNTHLHAADREAPIEIADGHVKSVRRQILQRFTIGTCPVQGELRQACRGQNGTGATRMAVTHHRDAMSTN